MRCASVSLSGLGLAAGFALGGGRLFAGKGAVRLDHLEGAPVGKRLARQREALGQRLDAAAGQKKERGVGSHHVIVRAAALAGEN